MARGDTTRAALISAAQDALIERGVVDTTIADVLTRAKQKNGAAVHYYFGGLDGLWDAVVDAHLPDLDARRMARLEAAEEKSAVEDLVRIIVDTMAESLSSKDGRAFLIVRAERHGRFSGANRPVPSMQRLRGQLFARLSVEGARTDPVRSGLATALVVRSFGELARREDVSHHEIQSNVDALVDAVTVLIDPSRDAVFSKEDFF